MYKAIYFYLPFSLSFALVSQSAFVLEAFAFKNKGQLEQVEKQAQVLITSGNTESYQQAKTLIDAALASGVDSARLHLYLGRINAQAGLDDKAILAFIEALILSQNAPEYALDAIRAREELSTLYMKHGSYDEAGGQLKKILEANPNDVKVRGNLGICYMQLGYALAALDEFKKVLEVDGENFVALYNSALALSLEGQNQKAAGLYQKAIASGLKSKQPLLPMAYLGLARCFAKGGNYVGALKMVESAKTLAPKSQYVYLTKAEILEEMKEPGLATEAVKKAIEINPHDQSCQVALRRIINRKLIGSKQETQVK